MAQIIRKPTAFYRFNRFAVGDASVAGSIADWFGDFIASASISPDRIRLCSTFLSSGTRSGNGRNGRISDRRREGTSGLTF
jgi:hypothetical protein